MTIVNAPITVITMTIRIAAMLVFPTILIGIAIERGNIGAAIGLAAVITVTIIALNGISNAKN